MIVDSRGVDPNPVAVDEHVGRRHLGRHADVREAPLNRDQLELHLHLVAARDEDRLACGRVARRDHPDDVRSGGDIERAGQRQLGRLDVVDLDDALLHVGRDLHLADSLALLAQHLAGLVDELRLEGLGRLERPLERPRRGDGLAQRRVDQADVEEDHGQGHERVGPLELRQASRQIARIHQMQGAVEALGGFEARGVGRRGRGGVGERGRRDQKTGKRGGDGEAHQRKGFSWERPRLCVDAEGAAGGVCPAAVAAPCGLGAAAAALCEAGESPASGKGSSDALATPAVATGPGATGAGADDGRLGAPAVVRTEGIARR